MATVDLKDAYYSIPVAEEDQIFLKFEWQGNYFQFICLPNGLASAPRLFTKVLKPIYAHLRSQGHFCMGHIDYSFLMGYNYTSCEENILEMVNTFLKLRFVIHPTKSVLMPTQEIEFLGFLLNSTTMTVRLPPRKATNVRQDCENLLHQGNPTVKVGTHEGISPCDQSLQQVPGTKSPRVNYPFSSKIWSQGPKFSPCD